MANESQPSKKQRVLRLKMWWLLMCAAGEMVGLGAAFAVGAASALILGDPMGVAGGALALVLITVAGALEGALVGVFQGRVLAELFKDFPRRRFITATAGVAAFGWAVGMSTPLFLFDGAVDTAIALPASTGARLVMAAGIGAALGLLFGGAQAVALRGVMPNRRLWVFGNVVGWAAGLPFTAFFPSLLPDGAPMTAVIVTGALGGLIAGAWVAVATAPVIVHWAMLDDGVSDSEDAAAPV